jgi:hypothetical protein
MFEPCSEWKIVTPNISIALNTHAFVVFEDFIRIYGGIGENVDLSHDVSPCLFI